MPENEEHPEHVERVIERIIALADFHTSTSTAELDAALAKAQGEFQPVEKNKTNPFFNSKYADLSAVWEACRQALSKNGISVTQWPLHSEDGRLHVLTRIACNGEWMLARISVPMTKQDVQSYGSAITYLRRYSLSALLGLAADEDDDAQATQPPQQTRAATRQKAATSPQVAQEPLAPTSEGEAPTSAQKLTEKNEKVRVIALIRKAAEQRGVVDKIIWADLSNLELAELKKLMNEVQGMSA